MSYRSESNIDNRIAKVYEGTHLTVRDIELLRAYVAEKQSRSTRFSKGQALYLVSTLARLRQHHVTVQYSDLTMETVDQSLVNIKNGINPNGKPYKPNTKHDYIVVLKAFLYWLSRKGYAALPKEDLDTIDVPAMDFETTDSDEILSPEQINQLIKACRNDRDRAFVSLVYESAGRINEVLRSKWSDLESDEPGYLLTLHSKKTSKTGKLVKRYVWLPEGAKLLLIAYKNTLDNVQDSDLIFPSPSGCEMPYESAAHILERAGKRVGLKVHLHLLRKSRLTNWVIEHYPDTTIRMSGWGNLESNMYKVYIKLGKRDISKEMKAAHGVQDSATVQATAKPDTEHCPKCNKVSAIAFDHCPHCGHKKSEPFINSQAATIAAQQAQIDSLTAAVQALIAAQQKK